MTTALEGGEGIIVTPTALYRPHHGRDTVPIVHEAGWDRWPVWTGLENLAPTGIRSPERPAPSQSLYRLRYPTHIWVIGAFAILRKTSICIVISVRLSTCYQCGSHSTDFYWNLISANRTKTSEFVWNRQSTGPTQSHVQPIIPETVCPELKWSDGDVHSATSRSDVNTVWSLPLYGQGMLLSYDIYWGHAVAQLVEALRYKLEGRGFNSRCCHWMFSLTHSFRPHCGPGVDSASNRNAYQQYFLGIKAAGT